MNHFFAETESWIISALLTGLMFAGWFAGFWRGKRMPADERPRLDSTISGAAMALLGLLLGFTFSMSLGKHEQRRQMVVTDSNAIGDFYTCASLLKQPVRGQLQETIRDYVKQRLEATRNPTSLTEDDIAAFQKSHERMQTLVGEAVDAGTPVVVPLVNTLNEVTSSHAARVAAGFDRVPPSIIILLAFAAIVTLALIGSQRGAAGERMHGGTIWFVFMVSLVVWVILDLNQPRKGMITVSQEPMERLLRGM